MFDPVTEVFVPAGYDSAEDYFAQTGNVAPSYSSLDELITDDVDAPDPYDVGAYEAGLI